MEWYKGIESNNGLLRYEIKANLWTPLNTTPNDPESDPFAKCIHWPLEFGSS